MTDRAHTPASTCQGQPLVGRGRAGSSVILVLLVLSVSLTLSYAIMRSQGTTLKIQVNSRRNSMAKEAAVAGMTSALHRMRQADWAGVDSTHTGTFGTNERFSVLYETGDAELTPGDADYDQWPYRVTLTSTGFSADPENPAIESSYRVRAVVQLVPRALSQAPVQWEASKPYAVYQYRQDEFRIEVPCHLEGAVRLQSQLQLVTSNSIGHDNSRTRYLSDLNQMRFSGYPDVRPFTGPLHLPFSLNSSSSRSFLNNNLGVATADQAVTTGTLDSTPLNVPTYRLYPGGRSYTAQVLSSTVSGTTLQPDPATNPLGIYYRSSDVDIGTGTTVQGTLLSPSRVRLAGNNITITPYELPALHGESSSVRLPVIAAYDLQLDALCTATIQGTLLAHRDFECVTGFHAQFLVNVNGRLVAQRVRVRGRTGWNTANWGTLLLLFNLQFSPSGGMEYLPIYAWAFGLNPNPILTLVPDATPVTDHWQNLNLPIYVPHADDSGLLWDTIRWTEIP